MKKSLILLLGGNLIFTSPLMNLNSVNSFQENSNIIVAQNYQKKRISHSNKYYTVSYDGNKFYFEDLSGNKLLPNTPESRNMLMDLAACYLTDEKVKHIGVDKLITDVNNLESLVEKAIAKNISAITYTVWETKTDPFKLLNIVFNIGNNLEIDPRFYVTVLAGNISSHLGAKQKEAVSLINNYPQLDTFIYGRIRMFLEDSEPYISPSYIFLRDALISSNYQLTKIEKDKLLNMEPQQRRQYILNKIQSTPEFATFSNTVQAKQITWENLRTKAASVIY